MRVLEFRREGAYARPVDAVVSSVRVELSPPHDRVYVRSRGVLVGELVLPHYGDSGDWRAFVAFFGFAPDEPTSDAEVTDP
jgi:hypothetical protein